MKSNSVKSLNIDQLTQLLSFTNAYADQVTSNVTSFSNHTNVINFADMKITDTNRDQVLDEAKKQAENWIANRGSHLRGKSK